MLDTELVHHGHFFTYPFSNSNYLSIGRYKTRYAYEKLIQIGEGSINRGKLSSEDVKRG
jgi:hypothetical protein